MTGTRSTALTVTDTSWQDRAACARSHIDMFPTDKDGIDHAKAVCAQCPCTKACREYALVNRIDHGVWGGTGPRDRRRILKQRKGAA